MNHKMEKEKILGRLPVFRVQNDSYLIYLGFFMSNLSDVMSFKWPHMLGFVNFALGALGLLFILFEYTNMLHSLLVLPRQMDWCYIHVMFRLTVFVIHLELSLLIKRHVVDLYHVAFVMEVIKYEFEFTLMMLLYKCVFLSQSGIECSKVSSKMTNE